MNVLAISCHPDDMEICCGGTLLRCKERGDNVTVCHVANGNMGHVVIEADELRKIRIGEAKRSGESAGFKVVTCDIGDLLVNSADKSQHDKLVQISARQSLTLLLPKVPTIIWVTTLRLPSSYSRLLSPQPFLTTSLSLVKPATLFLYIIWITPAFSVASPPNTLTSPTRWKPSFRCLQITKASSFGSETTTTSTFLKTHAQCLAYADFSAQLNMLKASVSV